MTPPQPPPHHLSKRPVRPRPPGSRSCHKSRIALQTVLFSRSNVSSVTGVGIRVKEATGSLLLVFIKPSIELFQTRQLRAEGVGLVPETRYSDHRSILHHATREQTRLTSSGRLIFKSHVNTLEEP